MPIVKEALDDIENEAKEIIKESPGFIKHVFDFNNDNVTKRCDVLRIGNIANEMKIALIICFFCLK